MTHLEPFGHEGADPRFLIANPADQAIADSLRAQVWAMAEIEGTRRECDLWRKFADSLANEKRELQGKLDAAYALLNAERLHVRELEEALKAYVGE